MPSKRKQAAAKRKRRPRKKIILFLVEGKSEIKALETALAATCDGFDQSIESYFIMKKEFDKRSGETQVGGDITSKYGINTGNIERLTNTLFFEPFFQEYPFIYPKDISRVVQIVDTDGAFVPAENVVLSCNTTHIVYENNEIVTRDVERTLERNERKKSNLGHLSSISEIEVDGKSRPYSVYFFSANLDHYLYNDANLSDSMKLVQADEFSTVCDMRPSHFYDTIQADVDYCNCTYSESWQMIQSGCNSLERHTNLGLLLKELEHGYCQ